MNKVKRFIKGLVLGTICSVTLAILGLNGMKYILYSEYYSIKDNVCINPGLNDNFVPQGIAVSDSEDLILTSGYMSDMSASRIYITNSKNESRYVELYEGDKASTRHFGGIALSGDMVYLSVSSKVFPIELSKILNSSKIDIGEGIPVNNRSSFIYADDNNLYVGEFRMEGEYDTKNHIEDGGKVYNAICEVYDLDDLTKPIRVYAMRDKVQGFAVTNRGTVVLSTSYGLNDSVYYIYESSAIKDSGTTYLDAPLYYLDEETRAINGPAMSEDLSYKDGKVYSLTESASNKYIFGKLFFTHHIYSLEVD